MTQRQRLALLLRELLSHEELPEVNCYVEVYGRKGLEVKKRVRSWVKNFNALIYGLLADSSATVVDTGGSGRSLRAYGDVNAGDVEIRLGIDSTPPSYSDYALGSRVATLATYGEIAAITNGYRLRFYGDYTPSEAVTIYELGLFQNVYDTGGYTRTVMWLREVFSDGISHAAGETKTYSVTLDITV